MVNSLRPRFSPSVGDSDTWVITGIEDLLHKGHDAKMRAGDDLLAQLPADRRSGAEPIPLVEAGYTIAADRISHLSELAGSLGVTHDTLFLTVFAILLARLAGQEAVTLRNLTGDPTLWTLAFGDGESFRSCFTVIANEGVATTSDQACAMEFLSTPAQDHLVDPSHQTMRLTLHLTNKECSVRLTSTTGLWEHPTLRLWLRYFDHLLVEAVAATDAPWATLPVFDLIEVQEFYRGLNDTQVAYPTNLGVHELVMLQAEQKPDAVAIASESQQITYRQLQERSDIIAHRLQMLGAGPGRPVAVFLERTAELPLALLAILKVGSCYLPLDLQNPRQRLLAILEESRPAAIIVDRSFPDLSGGDPIPVLRLDDVSGVSDVPEFRAPPFSPEQPAYMIFTSGSTGKPKGVIIPHRALANLMHSMRREPGFTSSDRLLAVVPISFDVATSDMFLPLVAGGTLVIADWSVASDPFRLAAMLSKFEITFLEATPVTWRMLVSSGWKGRHNLRMICGGDALPRDLAQQLLCLGAELWNGYGPTESTIWSSFLRLESGAGMVPVGPPIANTSFYVLDSAGQLLPPGVPGELAIGGIGVGDGYVNRAELTAQRFLPDPWSQVPQARMFRSGDLVRLVNEKNFEFFGRLDHQVKLRGYRIELGEIESALRACPGIDNGVAALRENESGEPVLVAYVTVKTRDHPEVSRLPQRLSKLLPAYMVPSRIAVLDAMPLTTSGKVDRKALLAVEPPPAASFSRRPTEGAEPQTALEEKLLVIFRDVLKTTEFGVTDNFFDYGGYSLLTVRLFTRIHRALDLDLPISLLFDAPTVRAFAEMIERDQSLSTIVPIRPRGRSAPLFVIHSYLLYAVLPQIVELDRPVYGVRELPKVVQARTIEDLAANYVGEILKVHTAGPLLLTGWCAAGTLTVEIARQLRALDHQVGLVALFDAECPGYRPIVRGGFVAKVTASLRFHLRRIRGLPMRQKLVYLGDALAHLWGTVLEALFVHQRPLLLGLQRVFQFTLPDALFNDTWSQLAATQKHTPLNYPGKVLLFRALDVPLLAGGDETLGWKDIAQEGVEVVFVPGDHESIFLAPNVNSLRDRLRQALQLPAG